MSPRRAIPQHKKQRMSPLLLVIGSMALVLVVVGIDLLSKMQPSATIPSASSLSANSRTAGDPEATISFAEYSDFQ